MLNMDEKEYTNTSLWGSKLIPAGNIWSQEGIKFGAKLCQLPITTFYQHIQSKNATFVMAN